MKLELRPHDDHGPSRVVDTLAEQILAKAPLLALERVRQRFEGAVVRPAQHPTAPAVVEQRVDRLLQHPLLVADDHIRRLELDQLFQAIVPVDDPAVEVVEIGSREAAAIEGHERAQLRWNDRNHIENHPFRTIGRLPERPDDLQALGILELLLHRVFLAHLHPQPVRQVVDVGPLEQLLDRLGAHLGPKLRTVVLERLPVLLLREKLMRLVLAVTGVDNHERLEVENAFEIAEGNVEEVPNPARKPLEEPDVADRGGQRDVPEPLASDFGLGDLDAALVTDDTPVLHALVLAAQALPVGHRTEDLGAEQPVPFRLERPIVDGLGLGDFTMRPGSDGLRRGEADPDGVEIGRQRTAVRETGSHGFSCPERSRLLLRLVENGDRIGLLRLRRLRRRLLDAGFHRGHR